MRQAVVSRAASAGTSLALAFEARYRTAMHKPPQASQHQPGVVRLRVRTSVRAGGTLSNLLKKISDTANSITQNLK